jgi:hypothetical protein
VLSLFGFLLVDFFFGVSRVCRFLFRLLAASIFVASPSFVVLFVLSLFGFLLVDVFSSVSRVCRFLFRLLAASIFVASPSVQELRSYHNKQTL